MRENFISFQDWSRKKAEANVLPHAEFSKRQREIIGQAMKNARTEEEKQAILNDETLIAKIYETPATTEASDLQKRKAFLQSELKKVRGGDGLREELYQRELTDIAQKQMNDATKISQEEINASTASHARTMEAMRAIEQKVTDIHFGRRKDLK